MGTVGTRLTFSFSTEQIGGRDEEREGQCMPLWIQFMCGYIITNSRVQESWRASLGSYFLVLPFDIYEISTVFYFPFNIIQPSLGPVSKCFYKCYGPGPEKGSGYLSCLLFLLCSGSCLSFPRTTWRCRWSPQFKTTHLSHARYGKYSSTREIQRLNIRIRQI